MKDWKKIVLGSFIAICLFFAFMGIFSFITSYQTFTSDIRISGYGPIISSKYQEILLKDTKTGLIWFIISLIAFSGICLTPLFIEKNNVIFKAITIALAIFVAVVCLYLIIKAFDDKSLIPPFNSFYKEDIDYYNFTFYQTYLNTIISGFVPLLIGSVLYLCLTSSNLNFKGNTNKENNNNIQ